MLKQDDRKRRVRMFSRISGVRDDNLIDVLSAIKYEQTLKAASMLRYILTVEDDADEDVLANLG